MLRSRREGSDGGTLSADSVSALRLHAGLPLGALTESHSVGETDVLHRQAVSSHRQGKLEPLDPIRSRSSGSYGQSRGMVSALPSR